MKSPPSPKPRDMQPAKPNRGRWLLAGAIALEAVWIVVLAVLAIVR
jgi:hypothetical protein